VSRDWEASVRQEQVLLSVSSARRDAFLAPEALRAPAVGSMSHPDMGRDTRCAPGGGSGPLCARR
jgi:hypothetical protein